MLLAHRELWPPNLQLLLHPHQNLCPGNQLSESWMKRLPPLARDLDRGPRPARSADPAGQEAGAQVLRERAVREDPGVLGGQRDQEPVPAEFLVPKGSPRKPHEGVPSTVFRYDLVWEFVSAIVEGRPAVPSFLDGWNAQIIADAVLESYAKRTWVETPMAAL